MKKKVFTIAIVFVVLITAILLISRASQPPMPVYKGETAEQWLDEAIISPRPDVFEAFRLMDTNAFPFLIRVLEKQDSFLDKINRLIYPNLPSALQKHWHRSLTTNELAMEWDAIDVILDKNPKTKQILPDLAHILEIPDLGSHRIVLSHVVMAVRSTDIGCVPGLTHELETTNYQDRNMALAGLRMIGSPAKAAGPKLILMLKDTNIFTRMNTAWTIWSIDNLQVKALEPVLNDAVNSKDYLQWREYDLASRNSLNPINFAGMIPMLIEATQSTNQTVSRAASVTLQRYGSLTVPVLMEQIENGDPEIQTKALLALKKIDAKAAAKYDNPTNGQAN